MAAAVVAGPLVDLADGRGVQLRDVELVGVEHLVERAVESRIGLQEGKKEHFENSNSIATNPSLTGSESVQEIIVPIAIAEDVNRNMLGRKGSENWLF